MRLPLCPLRSSVTSHVSAAVEPTALTPYSYVTSVMALIISPASTHLSLYPRLVTGFARIALDGPRSAQFGHRSRPWVWATRVVAALQL